MHWTVRDQKIVSRNSILAAASVAVLALVSPGTAWAGCSLAGPVSTWIKGSSGLWDASPSNWDTAYPNSSSQSACIVDGTSTVTLQNNSISVNNLQLGSGNELLITNTAHASRSLTVFGSQIINAGTIDISSTLGTVNASLNLAHNVLLTGGGTILLSEAAPNLPNNMGLAEIVATTPGRTFENFDNTIEGEGRIDSGPNLTFINDAKGTVDADFSGGTLVLSSDHVTNDGLLEATDGGTLSIANNAGNAFSNAGQMTTASGGTINVATGFTNNGQVSVGNGTSFNAANTYTNTGGSHTTVDGTLTSTTITNNSGASLQGDGTVMGNLFNYGTVKPGDGSAAGTLTVLGQYNQESTGALDIGIGGTSVGQYSQLIDVGSASLAGKLAIELLGAFTFANGEVFDVLNAHDFSGDFTSLSLDNHSCSADGTDIWHCGGGLYLTEVFDQESGDRPNPANDHLLIEVRDVPEPGSLLPLGTALAALGAVAMLRRRKKTGQI